MPTYDYECQDCGHRFELFQSITARVKRKCPACGKRTLERLIGTGAAVLFKGDGFYSTDYRSKAYREAAKAEGSKATDEGGSGKKGSEGSGPDGSSGGQSGKPSGKKSTKPES